MAYKKLQRVLYFANENNQSIINNYAEDVSELQGISQSRVIENEVLNSIVPHNSIGSMCFNDLYLHRISLGQAVSNIFSNIAVNCTERAEDIDIESLIQFSRESNSRHWAKLYEDRHMEEHFFSQLDSISLFLTKKADEFEALNNETEKKLEDDPEAHLTEKELNIYMHYGKKEHELRYDAKELKHLMAHKEEFFNASDFTSYIYMVLDTHWKLLRDYDRTYRMLTGLAQLQRWEDCAECRYKLIEILKNKK